LSANSVMRGLVHARRTLKGLVADLRFIIFDQLFTFRTRILDCLTNRKAFHDRPAQPIRFNIRF
ncbi:hypothetical protein PL431_20165, partial [Bacteroides xylanisolvens]|nr:hypothetical protein [Bacteroides xylanisolvens]MDB0694333.1 hypothetical protein [Bacteroides xylanisolvens]MDB0703925.1 hypothetical protein [Bacteroides xylanisolvens]